MKWRIYMKNKLFNVAILATLGLSTAQLQADESEVDIPDENTISAIAAENAANEPNPDWEDDMTRDPVDVEDFVETASAKGIAEIETARMALDEGTAQIHEFANRMIEDHTKANNELRDIARQQDLEVADDPTLMDMAKAMMLSIRNDESFDDAYIENQINAHEETIELFERASHSDNDAIRAFAREKLPILREHLQMANELEEQLGD
jgi:putative membrane protein|tara:strand:+ start:282 stop:905 length:624 start_codon:yes stop_codon:yes gene_type:complete